MLNILLKKNNEFFNKQNSGLLCGTKNDPCSINSCGDSTCCDNYECKLPDGGYQYKICVDKNRLFDLKLPDFKFNGIELPNLRNLISFIDGYYHNNTTIFNDLTRNNNNYELSKNIVIDKYGNFNLLDIKLIGFPSNKIPNNNFSFLFVLSKKSEEGNNKINEENIIDQENIIDEEGYIYNKIVFPNNNNKFQITIRDKNIFFISGDVFKSYENINIIDFNYLNIPDKNPLFIEYKDNYFHVKYNNYRYKSNKKVDISTGQTLNINYDSNIFTMYFNNDSILSQNIDNINFNVDKFVINDKNIYFRNTQPKIISPNYSLIKFSIDNSKFEIILNNNYILLGINNNIYKSISQISLDYKNMLSITYSDDFINIYFDGNNILAANVGSINFNSDNFIINKKKDLNINLHAILVYKKKLNINEINNTKDFFYNDHDKIYLPHFGDIFKLPDFNFNFNFPNICKNKL